MPPPVVPAGGQIAAVSPNRHDDVLLRAEAQGRYRILFTSALFGEGEPRPSAARQVAGLQRSGRSLAIHCIPDLDTGLT